MAFKKDLIEKLGYEFCNPILKHLVSQGKITKLQSDKFISYMVISPRESDTKDTMERYEVSDKKAFELEMNEILDLILETQKSLFEKGRHWIEIEEKVSRLRFNKLSKSIYSDESWPGNVSTNFLIKRGWLDIITIYDLIFKMRLSPKKTKQANKDNERLIAIIQKVIDKINI